MKLIVGLGNPGRKYTSTRHNIGFILLDELANKYGANFKPAKSGLYESGDTTVGNTKLLLIKPQTYMNRSGQAVRALSDYYQIESSDILVIYDEIALPFGRIRTRQGGESAGHKGIESIIDHIGEGFARMRIGIDNELRAKTDTKNFVLAKFSREERKDIAEIHTICDTVCEDFASGRFIPKTYTIGDKNE